MAVGNDNLDGHLRARAAATLEYDFGAVCAQMIACAEISLGEGIELIEPDIRGTNHTFPLGAIFLQERGIWSATPAGRPRHLCRHK